MLQRPSRWDSPEGTGCGLIYMGQNRARPRAPSPERSLPMSLRFSRMLRSVLQPSAQQRLGLVCSLLVVGAGSIGCVTASVEHLRQAPSVAVTNGEAVVVLGRDEPSGYQTEAEFTQCVAESLKGAAPTIYPQQRFINQLFPWFEPRI